MCNYVLIKSLFKLYYIEVENNGPFLIYQGPIVLLIDNNRERWKNNEDKKKIKKILLQYDTYIIEKMCQRFKPTFFLDQILCAL